MNKCKVCGYIYEGETLPDDFIYPKCKQPASSFEKIEEVPKANKYVGGRKWKNVSINNFITLINEYTKKDNVLSFLAECIVLFISLQTLTYSPSPKTSKRSVKAKPFFFFFFVSSLRLAPGMSSYEA